MRRSASMHSLASEVQQLQALLPPEEDAGMLDSRRELPLRVLCRFRGSRGDGDHEAWSLTGNSATLKADCKRFAASGPGSAPYLTCHQVLSPEASQEDVFEALQPVLEEVLQQRSNGCILCYGQTSTGKTYTMEGEEGCNRGLIPRTLETVFNALGPDEAISISMLEIYMERLRDLLDPESEAELAIVEDANREIHIRGLREVSVSSYQQALSVFTLGRCQRAEAATCMNERSSRSHSIFLLKVGGRKLCLVDLAGSECTKKTMPFGLQSGTLGGTPGKQGCHAEIMEEAKAINQSLLALSLVIQRLAQVKRWSSGQHIPYRSSKLTRVLSDCLGGCCSSTALVLHCSTSVQHAAESVSTLRFGMRAQACVNVSFGSKESSLVRTLRHAQREILRLRGVSCSEMDITPISGKSMSRCMSDDIEPLSPFNDVPCRNLNPWLELSEDLEIVPRPHRLSVHSAPSPLNLSPSQSRRVSLNKLPAESPLELSPPRTARSHRTSGGGPFQWQTAEAPQEEDDEASEPDCSEANLQEDCADEVEEEVSAPLPEASASRRSTCGVSWEEPLTKEDKRNRYIFIWEEEMRHMHRELQIWQEEAKTYADRCTVLQAESDWLVAERLQHLEDAVHKAGPKDVEEVQTVPTPQDVPDLQQQVAEACASAYVHTLLGAASRQQTTMSRMTPSPLSTAEHGVQVAVDDEDDTRLSVDVDSSFERFESSSPKRRIPWLFFLRLLTMLLMTCGSYHSTSVDEGGFLRPSSVESNEVHIDWETSYYTVFDDNTTWTFSAPEGERTEVPDSPAVPGMAVWPIIPVTLGICMRWHPFA